MENNLAKRIRSTIESAKQDIDLARQRCPTSATLQKRRLCAAIQVARAFTEAVDGGMNLPGEEWLMFITDRPLSDDNALGLWKMSVAPAIRATFPSRLKGRSGFLDFPAVVTDKSGKPVGRDGKPLRKVKTKHTGPNGEVAYGWKLSGETVRITDLMEEPEKLAVEERVAADWSDLFGLLIELIDQHEPTDTSGWPTLAPDDMRKLFKIKQDALVKRLKSQAIPNVFITTKAYRVDPSALPDDWKRTLKRG